MTRIGHKVAYISQAPKSKKPFMCLDDPKNTRTLVKDVPPPIQKAPPSLPFWKKYLLHMRGLLLGF